MYRFLTSIIVLLLFIVPQIGGKYKHIEKDYQIRELSSQEFRRVIRLPEDVDTKDPTSNLKDGILTLTFSLMQQPQESNYTRKIKIS